MLTEKCEEQERRWNLRVKGLKEMENEDTRATVISLLSKITPGVWSMDDMVDSVFSYRKERAKSYKACNHTVCEKRM